MYSMYSSFKRKSDSQSCSRNQPLQLMSSQISSTQYCCCQHSQQTLPTARSTENRAITSDKPALSDSAKEAKRVRRRRQRRWKAKGNKNDYVAYCFPKDCRSLLREGNLPFGDLVGKGEPAQGSSNGLRTIHAPN